MRQLDELWAFAMVVQHGGFSAAARAIGVSKANLSKTVARLEQRLQLRLIERSTRRLRVTAIGEEFHRHCQDMLEAADAAEAVAARVLAEPQGDVRINCPQGLLQDLVDQVLPAYLLRYPKVRLQVKTLTRRVDLIDEAIDLSIGLREFQSIEANFVARPLGEIAAMLVASPTFLARHPVDDPQALAELPTLSIESDDSLALVEQGHGLQALRALAAQPRMASANIQALRAAAVQGAGVALLPVYSCRAEFESGELIRVLPQWSVPQGTLQIVYASRKGLRPAVRALIDHLVETVPRLLLQPGN